VEMGVIAQTLTYTDSEDKNDWIEQAQNAYENNDMENCVAILSKACNTFKEELVKKPHSKLFRNEIQLIWEFVLEKVKVSLTYTESKHAMLKQEKFNPVTSLKAYIVDSLIETEWKKQCIGKFGGPKNPAYSWKEWYLNNEDELDQLETVEKKMGWAIEKGHINYVKFLFSQYEDVDINKIVYEHKIPVISKAISKNYKKLTAFLLDENVKLKSNDEFGWSPLHHAVNTCNLDLVKQIVSYKIALNIRNKAGHTPLHLAIMKNRTDIVKFLLSEGSKVNYKDKKGISPIYYALMTKDIHMIEVLVENGADLKVKDNFGRTLVHLSTILGYASVLKQLLSYKVLIDAKDSFGRTALHYAAQYGRSNCLDVLIKANAKLTIQDNFKDTPLLVAAFSEKKAETAILHEYGSR
tara:strand:+ start:2683 stop:3909 length:1227 start_codon:yes stop_codon:yes gene_type:complete